MKTETGKKWVGVLLTAVVLGGSTGCEENEPLKNDNPGLNNLNMVVAFGDSITAGSECACAPYPARLGPLIAKLVANEGIGGSRVSAGLSRIQGVINRHRPAFMLILYGVNDIIHGGSPQGTAAAVGQMAEVCKMNNVVPVIATYPRPIAGHNAFAANTIRLNRALREVAKAQKIRLVDLEKEFASGKDPYIPEWPMTDPLLMEPDGLHPNDAGTQRMALAFADLF